VSGECESTNYFSVCVCMCVWVCACVRRVCSVRTCVECCVVRACVECFVEKEQGFMQVSSRWPFLPITPSHEQFQCCCRHGMGAQDYAWGCLDAQLIFVLAVCTTVSIFLIFMMNGNSVEENKSWHSSCVGAHWGSHVMLVMRVRYCSILQTSGQFF
jgi:hypothetical protein